MLKNIKLILIALIILTFLLGIVLLILAPSGKTPGGNVMISATPIPVPTDFNHDYSKLNYLTPGKSMIKDVEKNSGAPYSSSIFGDLTVLYYKTPSSELNNVVVMKNGVVYYVVENIFGNYRGFYNDYESTFGQPDMTLYKKVNAFPWSIFLEKGIGIQSSNNQITAFLYFVPQDKNTFLKTIGRDLGLSETPPQGPPGGEQIIPAP